MAAITNFDRVGKTLDLLRQGLTPFVKREMQALCGDGWRRDVVDRYPLNNLKEKELAAGEA